MESDIKNRSSSLIYKAYKKQVVPDITATLCGLVVSLVDSLIAARFIGTGAMSAIALISPIVLADSCLHDLMVSGVRTVLIRYKSRGDIEQAKRAFAALTVTSFVIYIIVYALALIFAKNLLLLFTNDEKLILDGLHYFIPFAVTQPLAELGLCFERGFSVDGRNGFFGMRAIITNILNVILSIAAVLVFHGGIFGISLASCIASLLGYCWSFSHFFSKKCTMRPDYSVLFNISEIKKYQYEELKIGSVYAIDDGLFAAASILLNKAVIVTGGTSALAAMGICTSVGAIIYAVNGAVQQSEFSLCNMFYSDRDYDGALRSLCSAVLIEAVFGACAWLVFNLFSDTIGYIYEVDSASVQSALEICLRFYIAASIADCYTNIFSSFLLASEKEKSAAWCAIAHNVIIALCAVFGMTGTGFWNLLFAYMICSFFVVAGEVALIVSFVGKMKKKSMSEICSYSYMLDYSTCAKISETLLKKLGAIEKYSDIAMKAALLAEECNQLILYTNKNSSHKILVDFRFLAGEEGYVVTIVDTGEIFDPIHRLTQGDILSEFELSREILMGYSPKASYARVVNLNISHLVIEHLN